MRIDNVQQMLSSLYTDWQTILSNPRHIRKDYVICWAGYSPFRLRRPITLDDVIQLAEDGQYTYQITKDGSLVQIYYEFDHRGRVIRSATLAYYGYPSDDFMGSDMMSQEGEFLQNDINDYVPLLPNWFRIDYQPNHAKGVLHSECHLHISGFPNSRMIVKGIPTPRQFIEFIMAFCYPEIYRGHRLNHNEQYINVSQIRRINRPCIPFQNGQIFQLMTHLNIP